jgi:hypothetical protein
MLWEQEPQVEYRLLWLRLCNVIKTYWAVAKTGYLEVRLEIS